MLGNAGSLQGVRVIHAATSANMLTAFGRVMAERIVDEGADLYLVASSRPIYGRPADIDELRAIGGKPITVPLENNLQPWNLIANTGRLYRIFRTIQPHVVHTRGSVMGIVGRIAAWLARVPCVVHHQDDLHAREGTLSPMKRRVSSAIERAFANRTQQTFVVSREVAAAAEGIGFKAELLCNVGHDLSPFIRAAASETPQSRERHPLLCDFGISSEHFVVGAITRLEPHKGIDTLIHAAEMVKQQCPSVRFVVRGRGPEKGRLTQMINELELGDRFILLEEWLSGNDLIRLYRSFDIFALPTRREGFGMAFAEAMFLGVVPIAPNIAPVNEVVTSRTGILVEPTAAGFSEAVRWAVNHPEAVESLRDSAQQEAEHRWGGTQAADKVIASYQSILSEENIQPGK